jgi:hypothetical protein
MASWFVFPFTFAGIGASVAPIDAREISADASRTCCARLRVFGLG